MSEHEVKAGAGPADAAILAEAHRRTRRSFLAAGGAALAGAGLYGYLNTEPADDDQPGLLRRTFEANAALSRAVFQERGLAPTYPLSRARTLRVNGVAGLMKELVPDSWRLQVVGTRVGPGHPRYAEDVTAWNYHYTEAHTTEDAGHDTKTDPAKRKAAAAEMDDDADVKTPMSSVKMASAGQLAWAKNNEAADGTKDNRAAMRAKAMKTGAMQAGPTGSGAAAGAPVPEAEQKTGRAPRGMAEAGESESTLRPGTSGLLLTMDDLAGFPRQELVTQFKCVEGWSEVVHWAGFRMADFLEAYPPALVNGREPRYVYLETPDGDYYVGYDLHVLRHPQTLLVTEMMGAPLTQFHGAPLRLHTPLKYGYKQIKRIGLIAYTDDKPDDYWTKLGYDWYAGL